jgi:mRNA-degrading endonuclease toxin of MazEF toxin-antitoxin module
MPLYRGGIYAAAGLSERTLGLLVLTRDSWNQSALTTVVVAPIGPVLAPIGLATPRVAFGGPHDAQARLGDLFEAPKASLLELRELLDSEALGAVEDGLCDLLLLRELCAAPPRAPRPPAGPQRSPRWAEIYYLLGEEPEGERKRRVVVSHDHFNRATGRALAIRTTTSPRRGGPGFPAIQSGHARAVCGSLTSFLHGEFGRQRPDPQRLFLPDMAAIARELADVFDLTMALRR